jgi:hypothetical protein
MTTRNIRFNRVASFLAGVLVPLIPLACATTETTRAPKPADLEAMKAIGDKAAGTVVWSSTRAGLSHVFAMRTDGSDVRQLTRGDFTDWHPRFSPDGTKILFARSRDEGLAPESQASADDAWDLYTVGVDGKGIGKEVENASWGSWISNDEILFVRGSKILRTKLGGDEENEVLDTAGLADFAGATLEEPSLSPKGGLLALTLAGAHRQVGVWHLKQKRWSTIAQGTELGWGPDGASVYWVNPMGKEFSEIARVPVQHGERVTAGQGKTEGENEERPESDDDGNTGGGAKTDDALLDLQGKRSRELYPRLSKDGKWLVLGAGRFGLDREREECELYLWEVGTPPQAAVRLTFDAAHDSWPDIFVGAATQAATPADAAVKKEEAPAGEAAPADESAKPTDAAEAKKGEPAESTQKPADGEEAAPPAADEAEPVAAKPKGKGKAKGKAKKKR